MSEQFDLVVLGTGPSASRVAVSCAEAGWNVAVVDSRPPGGNCALRGCNPKKVLTHAAELLDWIRRSQGELIDCHDARIDWQQLIAFKRTFTEPVTPGTLKKFEKKGITFLSGEPRFTGANQLSVGERQLQSRHFVIATGAYPRPLNMSGAEHVTTSDDFLELDQLPRRVLFIGGGYISFEFANVAHRAGAEVTILEQGPRPLAGFHPELVQQLVEQMQTLGITIQSHTEVTQIDKQSDGSFSVHSTSNGTSRTDAADLVVHGAGRVPVVEPLNLDAANVNWSGKGIQVNEFLQSPSNPVVYAAGDVLDSPLPQLTPVANQQGRTIVKNLLSDKPQRPDYGFVPKVVFSVPPLAAIGEDETSAREKGLEFEVRDGDMTTWGGNRKVGAPPAGYRILVEKKTDRILGAHLLGPGVAETINLFALAMKFGHTATDLKSVLFVFPTFSSDVRSML